MRGRSQNSESGPDMEPQHTPEEHQAAAGEGGGAGQTGKVHRIGSETRGLLEDFTSWVELRLRLVQLDVQDYIRQKIDEATLKVALIIASLVSGLFMLVTLALFAGWALGHPAWGFLVVTGLLFLWTGILYARDRRVRARKPDSADIPHLSEGASRPPSNNGKHFSDEEAGE
ncbi:MAG: phage holin family protein [Bacteroidetes bacterium SB0662_bin_6]|nr:phage holin family protein [Bacteroidetes bacterium SB0668_bin_1]MYE05103.1 phage holin family protein [Bacteroidetes bacterium SB0662_bin_6]